jgi:hypothetical protein
VDIKFSKHAQKRAKLYGISESKVTNIFTDMNLPPGEHIIIKDVRGLKYPLKIVVSVEKNIVMVITNNPLKKARNT